MADRGLGSTRIFSFRLLFYVTIASAENPGAEVACSIDINRQVIRDSRLMTMYTHILSVNVVWFATFAQQNARKRGIQDLASVPRVI